MPDDFQNYGRFARYEPETPRFPDHPLGYKPLYLRSDRGVDWYDLMDELKGAEPATYGAADATGAIVTANNDPTQVVPRGLTMFRLSYREDAIELMAFVIDFETGELRPSEFPRDMLVPTHIEVD